MKKRQQFVSNSSSTSFVVMNDETLRDSKIKDFYRKLISNCTIDSKDKKSLSLPNHNIGCCEFGWEFKTYESLGDKLNFCAIQAIYAYRYGSEYKPIENIKKWIKEHVPEIDEVKFKNITDFVYEDYQSSIYIDHQSAYNEGENKEIVDDYDTMCKFMSTHSCVEGGNDNDC